MEYGSFQVGFGGLRVSIGNIAEGRTIACFGFEFMGLDSSMGIIVCPPLSELKLTWMFSSPCVLLFDGEEDDVDGGVGGGVPIWSVMFLMTYAEPRVAREEP